MLIGNIGIGLGVTIFYFSGLGNDPFSGMNMILSERIGLSYGNFLLIVNTCLFVLELTIWKTVYSDWYVGKLDWNWLCGRCISLSLYKLYPGTQESVFVRFDYVIRGFSYEFFYFSLPNGGHGARTF
jgi:uncharacterized membrane protein YczE